MMLLIIIFILIGTLCNLAFVLKLRVVKRINPDGSISKKISVTLGNGLTGLRIWTVVLLILSWLALNAGIYLSLNENTLKSLLAGTAVFCILNITSCLCRAIPYLVENTPQTYHPSNS